MTEGDVYLYVEITDPTGTTHPTMYVGSMPAWAAADRRSLQEWKRARRLILLDSLGMSDRPGFRFRYIAEQTPTDDEAYSGGDAE